MCTFTIYKIPTTAFLPPCIYDQILKYIKYAFLYLDIKHRPLSIPLSDIGDNVQSHPVH